MATKQRRGRKLKTAFVVQKTIEPFYTGGSISIDRDGSLLVTTFGDEAVITDVNSGQRISSCRGDSSGIAALALSHNSTPCLLLAMRSLHLMLYDPTSATLLKKVPRAHDAPISCCVADPTGTFFATGSADGVVKVWDAAGGHCTHVFRGHAGVISALSFDVREEVGGKAIARLASASVDCHVKLWDLFTRRCLFTFDGHVSVVRGLDFLPESDLLLSGGRDKVINIWNTQSGSLVRTVPCFEMVESVGFLRTENGGTSVKGSGKGRFYTAGEKGVLRIWDLESCQMVGETSAFSTGDSSGILEVTSTVDRGTLTVARADHAISTYDSSSLRLVNQFVGFNDEVIDMAWLCNKGRGADDEEEAQETHIAVATNSKTIRLYERDTLQARLLHGHDDIVLCLANSTDRRTLVSAGKDRTIRVWRPTEGTDSGEGFACVAVGQGHTESVGAVAIADPARPFVVSASQDRTIKLWDLTSIATSAGQPSQLRSMLTKAIHDKDINSVDVSPLAQMIASGSQDRTAKIFSVNYTPATKKSSPTVSLVHLGTMRGHKRGVWSVKFSTQDRVLVTGSGDKSIKIWSLDDFSCIKTLEGHTNSVLRVGFINVGTQVLSCGSDGLIKLWDVRSEECLATLDNHEDKVWTLSATRDESCIASGSADSKVTFWQDCTEEEEASRTQAQEKLILEDQELTNLINLKDYRNALFLALSTRQPRRLLDILTQLLAVDQAGGDSWESVSSLASVLSALQPPELSVLLEYLRDWNTNSRYADVAQTVLYALLRSRPAQYFQDAALETPEKRDGAESSEAKSMEILGSLAPYSGRHHVRVDKMLQESAIIDYTLGCMNKVSEAVAPEIRAGR